MKRIYNKLFSVGSKGFTLIELLVVIGILGILASALIATIDPFEQLKKAADANRKNILVEFLNANVRYYTTHTQFPWNDAVNYAVCNEGGAPVTKVALGGTAAGGPRMQNCIKALTDENELKQAFGTSTVLKDLFVTYESGLNQLIGCFQPESKSQQKDINTKFNKDGAENTSTKNCATVSDDNGCYWCTK